MNFSTMTTEQLLRTYRFHDTDRGTMTMQQELRRMYFIQETGGELRRRGVDPDATEKRAA